MLRRINDALPGLVLGIIVYGVIVELAGVWFVTDKVRYTTGLLIGISLACGMAVNIATVLRDAVELYGEDNAKKKIVAKSLLRYAVVVIVFFVMMKWNLGNLITETGKVLRSCPDCIRDAVEIAESILEL